MAVRSDQWHVSGWWLILLTPIIVPAIIIIRLVEWAFGMKTTRDRSPGEVVGYLYDALEGCGGDWDWDDFTSISITSPELDAIRLEAENIALPIDEEGKAKLRELLARARALI